MSVVVILKFALNFLHVLAWPLFALGFPLCASIRAIENNSNSDTQKLVTYWISFSLVLLFEHFFMNLLEWIQFWPHIKLMIICFLVIPYFDGAFYVYNHLVRPYLLLNREVVDEFNKWMVLLCKRDHFLAEAERYLIGNGPEALEKLIDKESHYKEPDIVLKDNNVVEVTEKKEVPAIKRMVLAEPSLDQTDATMEIKGPNVAVAAAREFPDIHVSKEVQKEEWACVICQVTTTSEKTFHEHLQGKNHKASYKALSAKKQPNIGVKEAIGVKKSTFKCNICNIHFSGKDNLTSHVKGKNHLAQVQVIYGCGDDWTCW